MNIPYALPLHPKELVFLREVGPVIFKTWGYRWNTTPNFEDRTHNSSRGSSLQHYSDIVFRNLYNICQERWNTVYRSDTVAYLLRIQDLSTYYTPPDSPDPARAILVSFLNQKPECKDAFKRLVRYDEEGASMAMLFIVRAAKALCLIASGKYNVAYKTLKELAQETPTSTPTKPTQKITPRKKKIQSKKTRD